MSSYRAATCQIQIRIQSRIVIRMAIVVHLIVVRDVHVDRVEFGVRIFLRNQLVQFAFHCMHFGSIDSISLLNILK